MGLQRGYYRAEERSLWRSAGGVVKPLPLLSQNVVLPLFGLSNWFIIQRKNNSSKKSLTYVQHEQMYYSWSTNWIIYKSHLLSEISLGMGQRKENKDYEVLKQTEKVKTMEIFWDKQAVETFYKGIPNGNEFLLAYFTVGGPLCVAYSLLVRKRSYRWLFGGKKKHANCQKCRWLTCTNPSVQISPHHCLWFFLQRQHSKLHCAHKFPISPFPISVSRCSSLPPGVLLAGNMCIIMSLQQDNGQLDNAN